MAEETGKSKYQRRYTTGSILALKGIVSNLGRTVTLEEMDEGIAQGASDWEGYKNLPVHND